LQQDAVSVGELSGGACHDRGSPVKVVSYNIHQGRSRRGVPILPAIAEALCHLDADVIACQEVLGEPTERFADQAGWLAERLGMNVHFAVNAVTRNGRLGNATFARTRIGASEHLDLSLPGHERRGALRTEIAPQVDVWNVHLGLTWRQRRVQWRRLAEAFDRPGRALVLCGDFNDWTGGLGRKIVGAGLQNALLGVSSRMRATFPSHRPWFGLDRQYFHGLGLVAAEVLRGEPWSMLSDHLPVEATFRQPSRSAIHL